MQGVEVQPHIGLRKGQVQPVALITGDPARALLCAKQCDSYKELAKYRDYHSYEGVYKGQKITIISHGVGVPGCVICVEELIHLGCKCIIRAGSCGSLRPKDLKIGDLCIGIGSADRSGFTKMMVPNGVPAISDIDLFLRLRHFSNEINPTTAEGIILTDDVFYDCAWRKNAFEEYPHFCKVVEMEYGPICHVCRSRGVKAGGIFVVDGSPLEWDEGNYDKECNSFEKGREKMLKIALEALAEEARLHLNKIDD